MAHISNNFNIDSLSDFFFGVWTDRHTLWMPLIAQCTRWLCSYAWYVCVYNNRLHCLSMYVMRFTHIGVVSRDISVLHCVVELSSRPVNTGRVSAAVCSSADWSHSAAHRLCRGVCRSGMKTPGLNKHTRDKSSEFVSTCFCISMGILYVLCLLLVLCAVSFLQY